MHLHCASKLSRSSSSMSMNYTLRVATDSCRVTVTDFFSRALKFETARRLGSITGAIPFGEASEAMIRTERKGEHAWLEDEASTFDLTTTGCDHLCTPLHTSARVIKGRVLWKISNTVDPH